jgi:holo-[acyl-carrier protein] synthase
MGARLGAGVDLVAVERVERLVERYAGAGETLFTRRELEYCMPRPRRYEHLAARFAAKEAVLKAFGTGKRGRMRWTDVEIVTEPDGGRPTVRLGGAAAAFAKQNGLKEVDVSLSHTGGLALAFAVSIWDDEHSAGSKAPYSGASQE